jgi:metallophosphoesterase (TIGR03767 family)
MPPAPTPPTTLTRTLAAGSVVRQGTQRPYRQLVARDGEPHRLRDELAGAGAAQPWPPARRRSLLHLAHVTDLQLADVQSPARFEFFNRRFDDPRFAALLPVQRPQEALTAHAVAAVTRTLSTLPGSPLTGAPLALVVTTGDAIDNAQWNELQMFLALFDGGRVRPRSGGPAYEGVQSLGWPDDLYWKPDGAGPAGPDLWRTRFGFPHHPGLLEAALAEFEASGLRLPWLACLGNHETLVQGVGTLTPALQAYLVGDGKPLDLDPAGFAPGGEDDELLEAFIAAPERFLNGPQQPITPDPDRRGLTRQELLAAHFRLGGRPHGHGFTPQNLADGTAYYCYDGIAGVRLIALDTNCAGGGADGCLDAEQGRWLERRLAEVHSRYRGRDGAEVRTRNEDRLVVIFSHHGPDTMLNRRSPLPLLGAAELVGLLHRFPNVVLWLNGHTHTNRVRPRPDPARPSQGFWEVTTCAVIDWPCQARLVELLDNGDGTLSIACTMVDYDAPVQPGQPDRDGGVDLDHAAWLASLHRELAANVPWAGHDVPLAGSPTDRNVDLRLPAPFPLGS